MLDLRDLLGLNAPWQHHAACSWGDRDRLAPIVGGRPSAAEWDERQAAAEQLCARCPVREQCAAAGDRRGELGVWGGSLRYEVTDPADELRGHYVADRLIPGAAMSWHDRDAVRGRLAQRRRAPVCGGVR